MSRLEKPEVRVCRDCSRSFTTNWPQRLCNSFRFNRAPRAACERCGKRTARFGPGHLCSQCYRGPAVPFRAATPSEIAWLAGIIEGEGYLSAKRGHGLVRVVMTDADVIARLYAVSAVGKLNDLPLRAAHHKPVYSWTILREESVLTLLTSVAPFLGTRRRDGQKRCSRFTAGSFRRPAGWRQEAPKHGDGSLG